MDSPATIDELNALVKQFQALPSHAEKAKFLWANRELQRVVNVIHFPKAPEVAAAVPAPAPAPAEGSRPAEAAAGTGTETRGQDAWATT